MNINGLALCARFSYPPNSLSLCGPQRQNDLYWYSKTQKPDQGTIEIFSQFSTLFPYLLLLASENKIPDPFDLRVVEAYWIGNALLTNVNVKSYIENLSENQGLKKRISKKPLDDIFEKISKGALPQHSFHVLNVYKRTGNLDIPHTVETLDACIINWGKVIKVSKNKIKVLTSPLLILGNKLAFGKFRTRDLLPQGENDMLVKNLQEGDWISYHWGYFCQKLTQSQLKNLIYYTQLSLKYANSSL